MGRATPRPPDAMPSRWRRVPLILTVALILRLGMGLPALDAALYSDELIFHRLAANLASGAGYVFVPGGPPTAWRPPLWPAVMAALYRVTGPSPTAARLLQMVLGTLLVWLVIRLAAALRPADDRVPAIAGWWAALSPTLLYHSHCLFSETLFGLCCGAGLLGLLRLERDGGWPAAAGAGLGLGLACLVRGTSTLLFVPLACGWLLCCGPRPPTRGLAAAAVVGLVAALVVLPWTVRNYQVLGGLALVDTNGPRNLLMGNHERTPFWRPWEAAELADRPAPNLPPGAGELDRQRASTVEALGYLAAHPGRCGLWFVMKNANLWGLARGLASGARSGLYGPAWWPRTIAAALWDGLDGLALLLCGALGLALATQRGPVALQVLIIAPLSVIHGLSYGHSRYRFMALLLLFGFAGMALARWRSATAFWDGVPPRRRRVARLACAGLLAAWLYDTVGLELLYRWLS